MNTNDENTFEKMGKDGTSAGGEPGIGAELEARVVAWVTGEASAFESAELERLSGERPELGIFKRRIAAVSGLVAEAMRPEVAPLRLGAERRAELLRKLGGVEAEGGKEEARGQRSDVRCQISDVGEGMSEGGSRKTEGGVVGVGGVVQGGGGRESASVPMRAARKERRSWWQRSAMIAAGLMVGLILSATLSDAYRTFYRPQMAVAQSMRREDESRMDMERKKTAAEDANLRVAERSKAKEAVRARPPSIAFSETADGVGVLEPMEVTSPAGGSIGYMASNTMSGTRLNMKLEMPELPLPAPSFSNQQLSDSAATDAGDVFSRATNTEGAVAGLDLVNTGDAAKPAAKADSFGFAGGERDEKKREDAYAAVPWGGAADGESRQRGLAAAPAAESETIILSPFEVTSTDKGYQATSPRLNSRLAKVASPITVLTAEQALAYEPGAPPPALAERKDEAKKQIAGAKNEEDRPLDKLVEIIAPTVKAPDVDVAVETNAAKEAVSTFSLHVSDVSFRLAQAALARGERPDAERIRPEEFYNAFSYGDPAPAMAEKIACKVEQSAHPVLQQRNLVRIAMKVPATGRGAGQPLRLTVLLDTSGSMEREDRAASVQSAMKVLVSLLGPNDRITLVGFSRQPRLLAEEVSGDQAAQMLDLVKNTPSEGGTNLEAALALGAELARRHQVAGAQNRIVLLTDGAANLGDASPERLAASIEALRQQGIAFDACGVGLDGLDDGMLEALTRKGDGRYYVLDTPESADAGFARQLAGAFRPAAQNVKVQVRFNAARVGNYRLIGFEKHRLKEEDFRNDKVDAAELAAEEAAVALYQVEVLPQGEGELGEVFVRFRDAASGNMVERSWTLSHEAQAPAFDRATPSMKLAGTAAMLAEKLRRGAAGDAVNLDELAPIMATLRSRYANEPRVQELVVMFEQMRRLEAK